MDCLLPLVLGTRPPPPAGIDLAAPPPPGPEKALHGAWDGEWLAGQDVAVAWHESEADANTAATALEASEAAWQALIAEQGWPGPISSDRYLIWVVLDPGLSGSGLTSMVADDEYPEGFPIVTLNPTYARNDAFFRHVAAHELAHTLHYSMRDDTYGDSDAETWFWEASAEWMAELALPDLDVYAEQTRWYAEHPEYAHSSTRDWHHYGMVALAAYVDETPGTVRAAWDRTGAWDEVLGGADTWVGFTGAYAAGTLRESALYDAPVEDWIDGEVSGELPMLGTHYWRAARDGTLTVSGEAVVSADTAAAGELVAVTGTAEEAAYTLTLGGEEAEPDGGCGCGAGGSAAAGWVGALAALAGRRGAREIRPARPIPAGPTSTGPRTPPAPRSPAYPPGTRPRSGGRWWP